MINDMIVIKTFYLQIFLKGYSMQKALIYYQTGTRNTEYVAGQIAKELEARNYKVTLQEAVMPFKPINPSGFDIIGFGYPIHAFNTPKFFLQFVRTVSNVKQIPAFIFKTSGEPFHYNNASSFPLKRILSKKGFQVIMEEHLLMPYNIIFRYSDSLVKQMLLHNQKMAEVIAWKLQRKQYSPPKYDVFHILLMYVFRLQWLGAKINRPFIRVSKNKCISCGLCARECPAGTIEMVNGYPKFIHSCTMCMRCVMECPQDAIKFGILNYWKVSGTYNFKHILEDESISPSYVNKGTKGYFKLFRKYYMKAQAKIDDYYNQNKSSK